MSKKPVIGITGGYIHTGSFKEGIYAHHDFIHVVSRNGGIPIVLPYTNSTLALEMVSLCDGIILTGGEDVDPRYYDQDPHPRIGLTIPARDEAEIAIAGYAFEQQIPLVAICRGLQVLNVALGGTLIQDISSIVKAPINHLQKTKVNETHHWIKVEKDSRLFDILKEEKTRVNSVHHQAIDRLSDKLKVVASASDGIIEAVEQKDSRSFLIGVQWHPEWMANSSHAMNALFSQLIEEAK